MAKLSQVAGTLERMHRAEDGSIGASEVIRSSVELRSASVEAEVLTLGDEGTAGVSARAPPPPSEMSVARRSIVGGRRAALAVGLALAALLGLPRAALAIDLARLYGHVPAKRTDSESCHPYKPFKCPEDNTCISIQYLCDGAPDCREGYDEDPRLCTAAKRPPVEETASFLQALLASHGPNYLEKLFGSKARDALAPLGGVNKVAIALSESQTIEDFGAALHLMRSDLEHLRSVFMAVENGDIGLLKSLGIKDSELGDVKFFLEKLVDTGFLD